MHENPPRLLLAFDFGIKHIGIAVGQSVTGQARPLCVLKARDGVPDWQTIANLLKEWQPDALVVGLPLHMDDSFSLMSAQAQRFARQLEGRFELPVHLHDERLTTFAAKGELLAQARKPSVQQQKVDALAATLLLEGWFAGYAKE